MPSKELPKLTDPELEIMQIIWKLEEATVNQVLDAFNGGRKKDVRRTTIQVQMERLEEKGWLAHRDEGRSFVYRATRGREQTNVEIVRDMSDRVFQGSTTDLVRTLLGSSRISPDEIKRLRDLLDQHGPSRKKQ